MRRRLIQWLLPELFFCLNVAGVVCYAVTSDSLQASLKLTDAQLGELGGAYFVTYAVSQLLLGCCLRTIPARLVLGFTAIISGLGTLLLSISQSYEVAMVARVLMGIGFGTALVGVVYVVGQLYSNRFAFMVNLSQSICNAIGASIAMTADLPFLQNFRPPFQIISVLLFGAGIAMLAAIRDNRENSGTTQETEKQETLGKQLSFIISNGQFWLGAIFYTGLFGSFLAYSDLWNIRFQIEVFNHPPGIAPMINAGVTWGLTIGGVITGIWANRKGFQIPARVCAFAALVLMILLYTQPLPVGLAVVLMVLLGFTLSAAPLGLAAMNTGIPESIQSLASPILLTIVFLGAGLMMAGIGIDLASLPKHAFSTYREGLHWFLVPIAIAAVSSLMMKPARANN
jgi:predicted MFS family arabinose efflux permease